MLTLPALEIKSVDQIQSTCRHIITEVIFGLKRQYSDYMYQNGNKQINICSTLRQTVQEKANIPVTITHPKGCMYKRSLQTQYTI